MPRLIAPVLPAGSLRRHAQPTFALDGVDLRPWRSSDAPEVEAAYADAAIQQWHARSMTADEAAAWVAVWSDRWEAETGAGWAIGTPTTLLGQIGLRSVDLASGDAEISYWVVPAARGRGLARHAVDALTAWGFGVLGLHRIVIEHSIRNVASCRVATHAGYRLEGTLREQFLHPDGWHDMHLHARLAGDPDGPAHPPAPED